MRRMRAVTQQIVVVGGGYAGIAAANRLGASARGASLRIRLVNPRDTFVERIRLHQVAAGTAARAALPMRTMLHRNVELTLGSVALIRPDEQVLLLEHGERIDYDWLIYAPGSGEAETPDGAYSVTNWERAHATADALRQLAPGGCVWVAGGGFTAIETASEIAASRPDLRVVLASRSELAPTLPASARGQVRGSLERLGVVISDQLAEPMDTDALAAPPPDMTIWCAGVSVPDLAVRSGLPSDDRGRLEVDSTLRSLQHRNVLGAGDAATITGREYAHQRQSCAAALPMGRHAADVVLAELRQRTPRPHSLGYVVQCLSIGRRNGLILAVHRDDQPRRLTVSGSLGALIKEAVCRSTVIWLRAARIRPARPHVI